ncbi:MAG: hypothetical protein JXR37_04500 [Kiritimatiellae bacterium]|nr:hypothetical protein [Kiritimatiellia bacterium]
MKSTRIASLVVAGALAAAIPLQSVEARDIRVRRTPRSAPRHSTTHHSSRHGGGRSGCNFGEFFAVAAGLTILSAIVSEASRDDYGVCYQPPPPPPRWVEQKVWVPGYYVDEVQRRWVADCHCRHGHHPGCRRGHYEYVTVKRWVPGYYKTVMVQQPYYEPCR